MIRTIIIIILAIAIPAHAKHKHPEKWYQERDCQGRVEVRLSDRTRADCLTETHVTEYDFGPKYLEAIGQALHYARLTGKRAEIVLILRPRDTKYLIRLQSDINFYNLPIDVRWVVE